MTNNNPTPTDVVLANASGNLELANQARRILSAQMERMEGQLRKLGKGNLTGQQRSEIVGVVAEILSIANGSIEASGKSLVKPTVATPPTPAHENITMDQVLSEIHSGVREPSPTRPYPSDRGSV